MPTLGAAREPWDTTRRPTGMNPRLITPLLLFSLLAAACGGDRDAGGEPVDITTWRLTSGTVDGTALVLVEGYPVTFRVEDDQADGTAACNQYGGRVILDGNTVSFPDGFFQTEMACVDPGVMELEAAFLAALSRVTGSAAGGGELRLSGDGVDLRFIAVEPEPDAALIGTLWHLDTLIEGDAASTVASPATLHIDDQGKVTGSTGCNSMSGTYQAATGFSPLATTKIACDPSVMDQESLLLAVLGGDPILTIEGSTLTVTASDGSALMYRADA
ncbi:MAG: META domain-containing protein [Acidimicrobiia bacterium]